MKKALIIGGGFAGCSAAHQFQFLKNWNVTLIERSSFLGAGVRTMYHGGHPYTFGPRHFLTDNQEVFNFLDKYCPLRKLHHKLSTYVEQDDSFYSFPINKNDINRMPDKKKIQIEIGNLQDSVKATNLEEFWLNSVGKTLYEKFIKDYNKKMWLVDDNKKLDTFEWSQKITLTKKYSNSVDNNLSKKMIKDGAEEAYDDILSGYPYAKNGYDDYFKISTQEAKVLLNTNIDKFDLINKSIYFNGEKHSFDVIINTISPDLLFDYCYGELPFIGRDIIKVVLPMENCFPDNTFFLYYANKEKLTRIVEYKKFTLHKSPNTLLGIEIPSLNGKHYPLPIKSEQMKAEKYFKLFPENTFSIGRAGSYDYNIDIDDCIEQALKIKKIIK